jgi:hypothetical protein
MICRTAQKSDLEAVMKLQSKYHTDTILEEDRSDGFVTTLFSADELEDLIVKERGLFLLIEDQSIAGYAMSGSWTYWKKWPMFQHMISGLNNLTFLDQTLSADNTYQYGPICIDKKYRGTGALEMLFDFARSKMAQRFPILITFVNKANPRSVVAHEKKLGLEMIQEFQYNGNKYLEYAYDTSKTVISKK